ncbi:MAG: hypothetical protein QN183_13320 [Armatimonadota bacterium]|nr:hypothetical protein [Armatimonadota bacterium]MDR7533612.1 hypothetical protein [Armatimonadota bacterium]MDR7537330.1 hypothetical protein [Armatimonadota bacterium]
MDDDGRIERSRVTVRWLMLGILLAGVWYLRRSGAISTDARVIAALATVAAAANLTFAAALRRGVPRWVRYAATVHDQLLTTALVGTTGGAASPFYYVYFIVLVSTSIRYGMGMAALAALLYNVGYVGVLLLHPLGGDLTLEGVKILAYWAVALYAGYLAARAHRQARMLQAYEETILRLRARIDDLEAGGRGRERP